MRRVLTAFLILIALSIPLAADNSPGDESSPLVEMTAAYDLPAPTLAATIEAVAIDRYAQTVAIGRTDGLWRDVIDMIAASEHVANVGSNERKHSRPLFHRRCFT